MDNPEEKDNENINEKEANITNKEPNNNKKHKKENNFKVEILGEQYKEYDLSFKLIVIGNASVGKSCLSLKAIKGVFEENYFNTVGFEFSSLHIKLNNQIIKLQIWDTAGQERYMSVNKNLFLRVQGMILMYDITNRDSFEHVTVWINNIREICSQIPIILVGNKCDLEEERIVTEEEGREIAENNKMNFLEASGKNGTNVKETFYLLAEEIIKGVQRKRMQTISLNKNKKEETKKVKECC